MDTSILENIGLTGAEIKVFLALLELGSSTAGKIVEKSGPKEKVGVVGYMNGKLSVIEYSCLPDDIAEQKDENGKLRFWAGSIAIHVINVDFVEKLNTAEFSLPYYKAFKAISYIDDEGKEVNPDGPNAIKFEKFIFDALKETTSSVTMEVVREHEFAPVKNKDGVDSVETAKELLINFHAGWLKEAGVEVPEKDRKAAAKIEISSLYALDAEELKQKVDKDLKINEGDEVYLGE